MLIELERALREVDKLGTLADGVDASQLQRVEAEWGRRLPGELTRLYTWRNGQPEPEDRIVDNWRLLPVEESLHTIRTLLDSREDWSRAWFPIAANDSGDYLNLGSDGTVFEFWHADDDRPVVAASLAAWLEHLAARVKLSRNEDPENWAWEKVDLFLEKPVPGGNTRLLDFKKALEGLGPLPFGVSQLARMSRETPVLLLSQLYFVHGQRACQRVNAEFGDCLGLRKDGLSLKS